MIITINNANAQYISIPDSNFAHCLISSGWSSCVAGNSSTGWLLDTLCAQSGPTSAIDCYGLGINDLTGIKYCTTGTLVLSYNNLTTLDLPSYYEVWCDHNRLTHLSVKTGTVFLYCNSNNLDSIDLTLPNSLQVLYCDSNNLKYIPFSSQLGNTYANLSCDFNRLDTVTPEIYFGNATQSFPAHFDCSHNLLRNLPSPANFVPISFDYVNCSFNQISSIDENWWGTTFLYNNNQLTTLRGGGDTIDCSNNHLTTMDSTYFNTYLNCSNNNLSTFRGLPPAMKWFKCAHNNLTSLPTLPDSLLFLDCHSNP